LLDKGALASAGRAQKKLIAKAARSWKVTRHLTGGPGMRHALTPACAAALVGRYRDAELRTRRLAKTPM
jgi:hypothetical protein